MSSSLLSASRIAASCFLTRSAAGDLSGEGVCDDGIALTFELLDPLRGAFVRLRVPLPPDCSVCFCCLLGVVIGVFAPGCFRGESGCLVVAGGRESMLGVCSTRIVSERSRFRGDSGGDDAILPEGCEALSAPDSSAENGRFLLPTIGAMLTELGGES